MFTLTTTSISAPLLSTHLNSHPHGEWRPATNVRTRPFTDSDAELLLLKRESIPQSVHFDSQHDFLYQLKPGSSFLKGKIFACFSIFNRFDDPAVIKGEREL